MTDTILFDMDGVLVDSESIITRASILALAEFGVKAREEDFKPFTGMGENRFIGGVAEKYGVAFDLAMKKRTYEIYVDIVADEIRVYEDTHRVLAELNTRGYALALASSADRVKVEANLAAAGIPLSTFAAVLCGEDVSRRKPDPAIYLLAAQQLGAAPARCLVVEDAVSGVQAAKAAGMTCAAVTTSFDRQALADAGADTVLTRLGQLLDLCPPLAS